MHNEWCPTHLVRYRLKRMSMHLVELTEGKKKGRGGRTENHQIANGVDPIWSKMFGVSLYALHVWDEVHTLPIYTKVYLKSKKIKYRYIILMSLLAKKKNSFVILTGLASYEYLSLRIATYPEFHTLGGRTYISNKRWPCPNLGYITVCHTR